MWEILSGRTVYDLQIHLVLVSKDCYKKCRINPLHSDRVSEAPAAQRVFP